MSSRRTECRKTPNKLKDRGSLDRISGLPNEVLGHILSFLPTTSVVSTSILSTRWKHLFQLTTTLYFEESYAVSSTTEEERKTRKQSFKKFVYLVLALHQKPSIYELSLECQNSYASSHLDVWISAAILKEVQRLYLHLGAVYVNTKHSLPSCLFNSKTLVILQITANLDLEVPNLICLPCLKVLLLKSVRFVDGNSVARFFSGCSSLEVLTLDYIGFRGGNACIYSATLKELTIIDTFCSVWIQVDSPGLSDVTFMYSDGTDFWYDYRPPLAFDVLKDPSSVTYLSLQGSSLGLVDSYGIPGYPNLAWLELDHCPAYGWKYIIDLLCSSPRLETVTFRQGLLHQRDDELEKYYLDWPVCHLHVEVITIHYFSGNERELFLLKYLLRNAVKLK